MKVFMNSMRLALEAVELKLLNENARKHYTRPIDMCADSERELAWAPATPQSAGYDLIYCGEKSVALYSEQPSMLLSTGLSIHIDQSSVAALIIPRSGAGHKKGLVLGNTVGLIDGDYQGEWFVSAWNRGQQEAIHIIPGDRIAQVIFVPIVHPVFKLVDEFRASSTRADGGFGSTGINKGSSS